jgi:hypothetical protein
MVPPIWLDESGVPRPVRRCLRCAREAPIYRFRLEHLRLIGWRLFAPAEYVNWCDRAHEFARLARADGLCQLVPINSEASDAPPSRSRVFGRTGRVDSAPPDLAGGRDLRAARGPAVYELGGGDGGKPPAQPKASSDVSPRRPAG